jgi:Zn-dependent alcohol dehydrogenase
MKTTAALLRAAKQPFEITTLDLAPPGPGEVQVRVKAAGVCHSDWHIVTGDTPFPMAAVLGHEGAGVIEAVGAGVKRLAPGDPVALDWAPSCGECFYCLNGRPSLCETFKATKWAGTMLDGTTRLSDGGKPVYQFCSVGCFADRIVVSEKSAIKMPASVPWEISALIGCAVTTGVGAVVNTAKVAAGSNVVVYGAGGVGLSVVMGAALAGAGRIIVVEARAGRGFWRHPRRRGRPECRRRDSGPDRRPRRRLRLRGHWYSGSPGRSVAGGPARRHDHPGRHLTGRQRDEFAGGRADPPGEDRRRQLLRNGQYLP